MKLKYLGICCIIAAFGSGAAVARDDFGLVPGQTYLQYEHDYLTTDRRHVDSIKIVHKTPTNWHWEVKYSAYPGDSDYLWENEYGGSAGFVLDKAIILDNKTYVVPEGEVDFQNSSRQYLLGAELYRKLSSDWGGYVRYRYQYRQYDSSDKYTTRNMYVDATNTKAGTESVTYLSHGNIGTHRFESGIDYLGFKNWKIEYILLYDYAKYTNSPKSCTSYTCTDSEYYLFDNKHGYLYNELKIQYAGIKNFIPYFEVDQKYVSGTSVKQQAVLDLGFDWFF